MYRWRILTCHSDFFTDFTVYIRKPYGAVNSGTLKTKGFKGVHTVFYGFYGVFIHTLLYRHI